MITLRRSEERGHAHHGWLDTRHTFSFADYYDPAHLGFRELRVINEDEVAPRAGFPDHGHRDMEIVTYVLSGALQHKDSMGNGSVIRPGDVQRMSAGTGVIHSEFNASESEPVRLLQIWIKPARTGTQPSYEQKNFPPAERQGKLRLIASEDARDGSVRIHQNVSIHAALLSPGDMVSHALTSGRHAWIQVVRGKITLNGKLLAGGDGAAVSEEASLEMVAKEAAELLLFDLN